jgi:hypothetical protein
MFFRAIHAKSLCSNLKFGRCIAKGHEREDPDQDPDRVSLQTLEGADIHGLGAAGSNLVRPKQLILF